MAIKKLGEILIEHGVIDADQLAHATAEHAQRGSTTRLGNLLIELGLATEAEVTRALASQVALPFADLDRIHPEREALARVPGSVARAHRLVPLSLDAKQGTILVALANADDLAAVDAVELASELFVQPIVAAETQIDRWLDRCYPESATTRTAEPTAARRPKRMGELLCEAGVVNESQLAIALAEQRRTGGHVGQILVRLGLASEEAISRALASQSEIEHLTLEGREPDARACAMIPEDFARRYHVAPLCVTPERNALQVAMLNPADIVAIDEMERITGLFVEAARASERQISRFLDRAYSSNASRGAESGALESLIRAAVDELQSENAAIGRGRVADLVDELIAQAIRSDATDLHLEPTPTVVRVRYRIDGDLVQGSTLAQALHASLVARIKVLADLDIALTRVPQDGKFQFSSDGRSVDLRVSTFPALSGESVVVRVLDQGKAQFTLETLGMDAREREILEQIAQRPNGLMLAVGPTGSGKTTTLYALLRAVNSTTRKVITLEDPVEYEMPLVTQCQINEKAGIGFASGLRSILRHDPDIVLVGEMRDQETARMALRASLTGHLVLSTLHANDAIRTLSRLRDMGLEPYLIASCLVAVCAQRLVRLVCEHCREPRAPSPSELELIGLGAGAPGQFVRGVGCPRCNGVGMRGRRALFEVLEVTAELAHMMAHEAPEDALREAALASGMVPFRGGAQRLARQGEITLEEAARVSVEA